LTFGEEVEFVWQQKISLGKVLFLLNRYIPMINLVVFMNSYTNPTIRQDKLCLPWFQVYNWLGILAFLVLATLMMLRTYALWGRSRKILISLSVLLVVCFLGTAGPALYLSLAVVAMPSPSNIQLCKYTFPNTNILYCILVSCIVFDLTIIILTLVKTVPARMRNGWTPLIGLFLKDGIQYFILMFLISVANIVVISQSPPALSTTLFAFNAAIAPLLGSHLMLNLRGSILRTSHDDEDQVIKMKTIIFNHHTYDETISTHHLTLISEDGEIYSETDRSSKHKPI